MGGEITSVMGAMGFAMAGFLISVCFAIPAFVMAFLPERAFRTRYKPRWVGIILLVVSLSGAIVSGINYVNLRSELVHLQSRTSVTQSTSQPK